MRVLRVHVRMAPGDELARDIVLLLLFKTIPSAGRQTLYLLDCCLFPTSNYTLLIPVFMPMYRHIKFRSMI